METVDNGKLGCWFWAYIIILIGSFFTAFEEGDFTLFLLLFIPLIGGLIASKVNSDKSESSSDSSVMPYHELDKGYELQSKSDYNSFDDVVDEIEDDLYDLNDDDDEIFGDMDHTNFIIFVSAEEYREVRTATLRLLKLCHQMSCDSEMRHILLSKANDKETLHGEYSKNQFFDFLKLMLGRDIIYLYEHMGYDAEIDFDSAEGQLLIVMIDAINESDEVHKYSDFKHVIRDDDVYSNQIRDNYEAMFDIYKNQTEAGISAKGIDDFSLVMVIMCARKEEEYLTDMRNALYQLASSVADAAVKTDEAQLFLEEMIQRAKDDEDDTDIASNDNNESDVPLTVATMDDLNALIGLNQVKKEVTAMKNFIEVNRRREEAGMKTPPVSYHCVFTGNPGTGKTTVARIVAGIYKELGILKKGHLVETDRSGLVAEYVGQTAVKTNKVIDSALDGVLFIDEAYSLVGAGNEDFGKEAIATLVKRMEDDRERLVVILAGYEDEMQQFIESNPGLRSRFNRYIHFEDYTADELKRIYLYMLKQYDFVLEDQGEQVLTRHLVQCVLAKGKDFGNARYVRNLFERTIKAQAVRLAKLSENDKPQLATITADDITAAIADNP
jgi:SpoVK/Ycf46/Vps4 family AAA+-type ATPase